jgi:dolichol-phosphate mannosyltransferase
MPQKFVEADPDQGWLHLLTLVIPARNDERCIRSTVEHLDLELWLTAIAREIIVVDDGSSDRTWER